MRAWLVAAGACLLLSACAQTPGPSLGHETRPQASENPRARIHTELAAHYFSRGQHAVALQELAEALSADGGYAPAHNMLGLVHGELREDAKAEASFRQALSLQRNYSEAYNNYGWFLCQRGRIDEALAQFEAALTNPLYASPDKALANAGICSLKKGDLQGAEAYLQRALKRVPNQPNALRALADVHFRQGNVVSARQLIRQLPEAELDAKTLWLGLRAERMLGDHAAEASYAAQLRRRFPDSIEALWLKTGQYDQPGGRF